MTDPRSGRASGDSAGIPWEGRRFDAHASGFAGDDGSMPPQLSDTIARFRSGTAGQADVVDAVRASRLLVPLVAHAGEKDASTGGDKRAELSIVSVAGPDGRTVLPVFGSAVAMSRWNPAARPVPVDAVRVALAAVDEGTELIVVDPGSDTEVAIRRPAVWAIARQVPWQPCFADDEVAAAFEASVGETMVRGIRLAPGDPGARLAGPELEVVLEVESGLDAEALAALLAELSRRWSASTIIATRVDSMRVRVVRIA